MIRFVCAFSIALVSLAGLPLHAEGPEVSPLRTALPAASIFSGIISAQTAETLTVVRRVPGREAVTRTFVLNTDTSTEGQLRMRARVTVRYRKLEDGGLAADHIIVR